MTFGNAFERDAELARRALDSARARAFWIRLLTLGILDGARGVAEAKEHLAMATAHLQEYQELRRDAQRLDDDLLTSVQIQGVRVSRNVFSDLPAIGHADYPLDWEFLRQQVLDRDGYCCTEADGCCDGPLQIHHLQPLSKGGSNSIANLATLCLYHHSCKHPHMMAAYYGSLRS